MNKKKLLLYPVGVLCLVVGAAGFVLPILPGWPFLFVGLSIVAPRHAVRLRRWAHRRLFKQETFHFQELQKKGVHAGFTTKQFPLVLKKTDDLLDLSNQVRFRELLWKSHVVLAHEKPASGRFAFLNQVHGDNVVVLEDAKLYEKDGFYHFLKADAVITDIPKLTLLVMTADCLSVFLTAARRGPDGRWETRWVGLVHAGWRGTQQGIVKKTVEMLRERSGCDSHQIFASFGPSIGCSHYEVGPEFSGYFKPPYLRRRGEKLFFDLAGENRRQLQEAGVLPRNIADPRICTVSRNKNFYSFRKEKENAGRMISFITKL